MAAGGNSGNIALGAGRLYVAAVSVAEPTNGSTVLPSADWRAIGYTEDGTTVSTDISSDPIEVAEEYDPVLYVMTSRMTTLSVSMAEITRRNLALAMGGGAAAENTAEAWEPPDPGTDVAVRLVWDSLDTPSNLNVRWLFRQARVSGSIGIQRNKAPNKALLPVTFNLEKPAGLAPLKVFPNVNGLV